MSDKTYVLSLSADTFNAFKMDFDSALQRLLQKMDRLQSDSASINCKISVALTPAPERNFDATQEGDTVQVMKPSFSHEISTEIKVKDKTTGNLSGNRKLVWDEELMEYVMKDIDDGQPRFSTRPRAARMLRSLWSRNRPSSRKASWMLTTRSSAMTRATSCATPISAASRTSGASSKSLWESG